jgi:hypothetical protein
MEASDLTGEDPGPALALANGGEDWGSRAIFKQGRDKEGREKEGT